MKRFAWRWLAFSSLVLGALAAAETRPQYGGTVHVATHIAPMSLDPADNAQPDSSLPRSLTALMFDQLVTLDRSGHAQPWLATSWQPSPGMQRWQLHLGRGVKFHDGSALTPDTAAASLRAANPTWNISSDADSITIDLPAPNPELLAELALPRNAIVKKNPDGTMIGTGPFRVVSWQAWKKLTLGAEENCWRGRPFLDSIEIDLGKSYRDQLLEFELGKLEIIEIAPEQLHRVASEGRAVESSAPIELLALAFSRDASSADEKLLRQALALSVERTSIRSVLLQGAGQPAASLLPNWLSGYGFVFPTDADLSRARQLRAPLQNVSTWTVGYDPREPLDRLLVERIALNARDAGLSLQPTDSATADLRLVRWPLDSTDPWIALDRLIENAGMTPLKTRGGSVEDLYEAESSELASQRVLPLFHLPVSYAVAPSLKSWTLLPDGSWSLADAWLGSGKP